MAGACDPDILVPAVLFCAGIGAAVAMALWVPMPSGHLTPTAFDPASCYMHEFLFGYLGAVIVGFLLTAEGNWNGGLPIVRWRACPCLPCCRPT